MVLVIALVVVVVSTESVVACLVLEIGSDVCPDKYGLQPFFFFYDGKFVFWNG